MFKFYSNSSRDVMTKGPNDMINGMILACSFLKWSGVSSQYIHEVIILEVKKWLKEERRDVCHSVNSSDICNRSFEILSKQHTIQTWLAVPPIVNGITSFKILKPSLLDQWLAQYEFLYKQPVASSPYHVLKWNQTCSKNQWRDVHYEPHRHKKFLSFQSSISIFHVGML